MATRLRPGSGAAGPLLGLTPPFGGGFDVQRWRRKRYITNVDIANVLTVMARTPVPGKPGKDAITAFVGIAAFAARHSHQWHGYC